MSRTKIITIICWAVAALVLIGLVVWFLTGSLFGIKTGLNLSKPFSFRIENLSGPYNEVGSYSIDQENINGISLNWVSGGVTVKPYDGEAIQIKEYAQRELNDSEKLNYSISNNTLKIQYVKDGVYTINVSKKIEVLVPAALSKNLDRFSIDCTSADLNLGNFNIGELIIKETSGTTNLSETTAEKASVNSVSGKITITGLTAGELNIGTVSGAVELSDVNAAKVSTGTTSGALSLYGTFTNIKASSVSGGIAIQSSVIPESLDVGTTSGAVKISVPSAPSLNVSYSTVSGSFKSEIPVTIGTAARFSIKTISGSINITALK